MPKIKISHIVSFSSEDPVHCANNILSSDTSKKWKCLNPGEKSVSVVLQLEKASVISGIDIGNEHSAYVEILVNRSCSDDEFKLLLVMSSFMTPSESKQSININKVRMFTREHFQDPERNQKWDRVKFICTQPFNRHVQYGLSFVTLHTPGETDESSSDKITLGKFLLRPDSPDHLSAGSLFAKRKELTSDSPLTGAAAIRQASSTASLAVNGSPACKPRLKDSLSTPKNSSDSNLDIAPKERNRNEILYNEDDEQPNKKIDKLIEKNAKEKENKKKEGEEVKQKQKENEKDSDKIKKHANKVKDKKDQLDSPGSSRIKTPSEKRKIEDKTVSNKKPKKAVQTKPFNKLLEGVVIVISGIQNPERSDIRTKALQMGSKYMRDWDHSCTHLICAFPNTPKFNQVKGKGKIVTKEWIFDCYRHKKRFPWRRYALDKKDKDKPESEDEILEKEESEVLVKEKIVDSGSDTEDEIERIQANLKKRKQESKLSEKEETEEKNQEVEQSNKTQTETETETHDPFSADTDEEIIPKPNRENVEHELPNFFEKYVFYIDDEMESIEISELKKYIVAYKGFVMNVPSEVVDIVITNKKNISHLAESCPEAKFVNYKWIWQCHNKQTLIPLDNFEIK